MIIRAAIAASMIWATSAFAQQDLPAHYITTGIAANDTLNIRSAPDASSEIVGEYGPYTVNIEVIRLSDDGKWGFVGLGEGNGWVSMRFLEPSNHQDPNAFPRPIRCFGNEPFWNLNVTVRGDEYQELGDVRRDLNLISENAAPDGAIAVFEEGPTLNRTLIVKKGLCQDGMSDREFGWTATLFNEAPDGNTVQSGCCTLDANR